MEEVSGQPQRQFGDAGTTLCGCKTGQTGTHIQDCMFTCFFIYLFIYSLLIDTIT